MFKRSAIPYNLGKEMYKMDVNKKYTPCNEKSAPLEDKPLNIPYKLYFGNSSESWEGG